MPISVNNSPKDEGNLKLLFASGITVRLIQSMTSYYLRTHQSILTSPFSFLNIFWQSNCCIYWPISAGTLICASFLLDIFSITGSLSSSTEKPSPRAKFSSSLRFPDIQVSSLSMYSLIYALLTSEASSTPYSLAKFYSLVRDNTLKVQHYSTQCGNW